MTDNSIGFTADCVSEAIERHRLAIDEIDDSLVELLNERAMHSSAIRDLKIKEGIGVYDARREEEIVRRLHATNKGPLYNGSLEEIFATILKVMKEMPRS